MEHECLSTFIHAEEVLNERPYQPRTAQSLFVLYSVSSSFPRALFKSWQLRSGLTNSVGGDCDNKIKMCQVLSSKLPFFPNKIRNLL